MEDTTMMEGSQPLFQDKLFAIVPTTLLQDRIHQLAEDIAAGGGTVVPFDDSTGRIEKLNNIDFIISATTDFPDYYRALDLMKDVVKPTWVDACIQTGKSKNPRAFSPDPALFMSDVIVCCGDIPEGDQEAIAGGVLAMGGQFSALLTKMVTHLIALDMDEDKCQMAVRKHLPLKIVLPHWFDDCLKVGRRINERPYLLPDPEITRIEKAGPIPPTKTSPDIRDATNPEPKEDPYPTTPPAHLEQARKLKAFEGKKVKLGEDLPINSRLKGTITDLIKTSGGDVTTNINEASIYVCSFRDGDDYIKASQARKDVGSLGWLYYLITHDTWTNPMRRMLHYPRPREGVPGFSNYKISISSYTGEARVYLENLIKATGAEFTKTFKQDNTHLIAAHKNSEKCDAAQEWNVKVLNHLWLEDSYAKCKQHAETDPRYTYFPLRTNMGEILGSTEIDRDAVERRFFPKSRKPKAVTAVAQSVGVPGSSSALGRAHSDNVGRGSPLVEKTSRRTKTVEDVATPVTARHIDGKENRTPGSRGAKDRATAKLHESAGDIAQFEKEMKRKGGVVYGGRRHKEEEAADKSKKKARDSTSSKRSIDEVEADDASTEDEAMDEPAKKNKKARKQKLTPIKYRILVSKDERWTGNPDRESKDKARLREIGLFVMDDYKKADLLCAPKVVRTKKFVAAIASGPTLISSAFIDYALRHNKIPAPEKFPIEGKKDFEKSFDINVDEGIARAKQNKHRLLKDWVIFCTQGVSGGFDTYNEIIQANGGRCQMWKGRTTTLNATKRKIDTQPQEVSQNLQEDEGDILYLISDPKKSEFPLWKSFRELAVKHDMKARIVKTEWVLFVAMAQYVHWDAEWELNEEVVNAMNE
ncbi:hypothetical protein K458DRAFT_288583 [Lentithecium fluviatile CBS 122367]|uniref:BRCT domain-containing protein n=1 Tax=Lentithecium fluviatile CBS 122367 TaxID=1168545 RepID=A0A6G1JL44_9PLEO|nr:hypothetical protein K458DRAFT_288583 [Lentithecium fluviatile CBS 122367]